MCVCVCVCGVSFYLNALSYARTRFLLFYSCCCLLMEVSLPKHSRDPFTAFYYALGPCYWRALFYKYRWSTRGEVCTARAMVVLYALKWLRPPLLKKPTFTFRVFDINNTNQPCSLRLMLKRWICVFVCVWVCWETHWRMTVCQPACIVW